VCQCTSMMAGLGELPWSVACQIFSLSPFFFIFML
jgi:hypothetical protein